MDETTPVNGTGQTLGDAQNMSCSENGNTYQPLVDTSQSNEEFFRSTFSDTVDDDGSNLLSTVPGNVNLIDLGRQPPSTHSARCSSGGYTDSSDIEVLLHENDSSDSIEVLDSDRKRDSNVGFINHQQNCRDEDAFKDLIFHGKRSKEANQTDNQQEHCHDAFSVDSLSKHSDATTDSVSFAESVSSGTPTFKSTSSSTSGTNPQGSPAIYSTSQMTEGNPTNTASSIREEAYRAKLSGVISYEDICQSGGDSPQSSCSHSPFDSPTHRSHIPIDANVINISNGSLGRPDSLSLPRPLQYFERQRLTKKGSSSSLSEYSSRSSSMDALIEHTSITPLHKEGTLTMDGDMIAFVAEGLETMIKMSSPLSRKGDSSGASYSGGSQTPSAKSVSSISSSASGWSSSTSGFSYSGLSRPTDPHTTRSVNSATHHQMHRSPSVLTASPDDIPPVDPRALMEIDLQARKVAMSLDHMMNMLKNNLHKMSALTYHCLDAYKDSVDNTCDSVDASIKSMYALMAKCEEVSKSMKPIYTLSDQIKEIKRLMDLFELQMARDEK